MNTDADEFDQLAWSARLLGWIGDEDDQRQSWVDRENTPNGPNTGPDELLMMLGDLGIGDFISTSDEVSPEAKRLWAKMSEILDNSPDLAMSGTVQAATFADPRWRAISALAKEATAILSGDLKGRAARASA